jgi:Rieske Fe-S protein
MGARDGEVVSRRVFVARGAIAAIFAFGRNTVRAQVSRLLRYGRLSQPVVVPLDAVSTPWRVRPFVAEAVTLPSAATPNQSVRISGMIVRLGAGDRPDNFAAVCARCPHELCDVDYVDDPKRLPQEIVNEIGRPVTEPVYVCPCHNSTFKVDGERLSGPAPRGLYRFRVTGVAAAVEIAEVEEDVLIFV